MKSAACAKQLTDDRPTDWLRVLNLLQLNGLTSDRRRCIFDADGVSADNVGVVIICLLVDETDPVPAGFKELVEDESETVLA